jgi:hypothetical protein
MNRMACPTCGNSVSVSEVGMVSAHYYYRDRIRYRCRQSELDYEPAVGQRCSVTLDVIVPAGWNERLARARIGEILRAGLEDVFVAAVAAEVAS